ncbi:hypothetical protein Q1695_002929 [Nippostrongylus brasiliensis]|nr:hypothetical protein Q1695_002929 [Nippostrongylus brasiliensis]
MSYVSLVALIVRMDRDEQHSFIFVLVDTIPSKLRYLIYLGYHDRTAYHTSDSEDDVSVSGSEVEEEDDMGVEMGDDDAPVSDGEISDGLPR